MSEQFASDNYSGICPEVLESIIRANSGHAPAYGEDDWTTQAADRLRELFGVSSPDECEVFFVFNGTAANALALAALCESYHSIICHEVSHIETDECGAPEFFSNGSKILLGQAKHGKLTPQVIEDIVNKRTDIHYPKPKVISITQPTELGTVYTPEELRRIHEIAKKYRLKIHMDGARLANAVVSLGVPPHKITVDVGVDVLCFGGTKNGMLAAEAVLFFNKELAEDFDYRCKQSGQLSSKMRFTAAQFLGLLENDTWLKNAAHANHCAARLEEGLRRVPGVTIMFPRQANAVFVKMPQKAIEQLRRKWLFYTFIGGGVRFMCTWDTTLRRVEELIADVHSVMKSEVAAHDVPAFYTKESGELGGFRIED